MPRSLADWLLEIEGASRQFCQFQMQAAKFVRFDLDLALSCQTRLEPSPGHATGVLPTVGVYDALGRHSTTGASLLSYAFV